MCEEEQGLYRKITCSGTNAKLEVFSDSNCTVYVSKEATDALQWSANQNTTVNAACGTGSITGVSLGSFNSVKYTCGISATNTVIMTEFIGGCSSTKKRVRLQPLELCYSWACEDGSDCYWKDSCSSNHDSTGYKDSQCKTLHDNTNPTVSSLSCVDGVSYSDCKGDSAIGGATQVRCGVFITSLWLLALMQM
eukprot:TRINITY_DN20652_c0_g1_i2.p1 TRINITY_DN20652_c0_g1~~TRINITY_DN20652_c0_g1_i2.p1  ORF type:complete len:193 (+),score=22.63 TRINITY_DN20652_c0_g1_i2:216-794(+)